MPFLTRLKDACRKLFGSADHSPGHKHPSLAKLDPRLLDDLGITLEQAEELDKRAGHHESEHRR